MPRLTIDTPLGPLSITEQEGMIAAIGWRNFQPDSPTPLLQESAGQITDYFAGTRKSFDLPLNPAGTEFQQRVWKRMSEIPYGETLSYGELAQAIGTSPRPVGTACGRNPIPVIIPCHRVLAADQKIGGYTGGAGIKTKAFLLDLEAGQSAPS